jgi:hypothetical protein
MTYLRVPFQTLNWDCDYLKYMLCHFYSPLLTVRGQYRKYVD